MAYTKYSLTPANNTAAPPDGAPEGMLPSAVNDTMRDMMAQIRDCGDGIRDGTYTMTAPKITGGTITGATLTGNTFTSPVISGGSINNTPIGATTANTGAFTTLGATGVATFSAGTVSAPAITTTGDTNTGIFFPAADTIAFTEGGVESMRIDSSGNVGIGTSSPTNKLTVDASGAAIRIRNTTIRYRSDMAVTSGGLNINAYDDTGGVYLPIELDSVGTLFNINGTERMRIDSSGVLLVGATTRTFAAPATGGASFKGTSQSGGVPVVEIGNTDTATASDGAPALMVFKGSATTSSSARFIQFSASNDGTTMGAIVGNGAGLCQFANFSDVSLKKNIQPLTGALNKVISLKPSSYDMIADGSHVSAGFIAQDVQKVYPEYVIENMSNEGEKPLMAITGGMSGGFIAELVCAIQELKATVDAQAARIVALESN